LLAVGDDDPALIVEMADVAGVEPAVLERGLGLRRIAPIALHHQLAAHQYLAVRGDLDLGILQRRADRVHLDARARPVAAYDGPGLGLAVALEQGEAERVEEDTDLGVERRPARHHRLDPAAEPRADLGPERARQYEVHRQVAKRRAPAAAIGPGADLQRALHQIIGEL